MAKLDDTKNKAIQFLINRFSNLQGIYLFGSYATGQTTPDSDIDLAILPTTPIDKVELFDAGLVLGVLLNTDVDLVDLRNSSTVFRMVIINQGKRIYCMDEYACESFEGLVYSMYIRLNEMRIDIIEALKKQG